MISHSAFVILCTSSAYGAFVALAFVTLNRGNRRANLYLAGLIFLVSLSILLHAFLDSGNTRLFPHLQLLNAPFGFLFGPLLFFHLGALNQPSKEWSLRNLLKKHGAPFLMHLIYLTPFWFTTATRKTLALDRAYVYFPHDRAVTDVLQNTSLLIYVAASFLTVKHSAHSRDPEDMIQTAVTRWSKITIAYIGIAAGLALTQSISHSQPNWFLPLVCAGFFGVTGYFWFLFPEVFISILKLHPKYQKSGLKEEQATEFLRKLLKSMESEKLYLNANLSQKELASQLGINQVYLSQIINEKLGKSFFDFINSYRIKAAIEALNENNAEQTILDVSYAVGFNSKSTFYTAFKKETGVTPGEHLKRRSL